MENLNSTDLKLSQEDSRDIIEILARKRNINVKYILTRNITINVNQMINYCKL